MGTDTVRRAPHRWDRRVQSTRRRFDQVRARHRSADVAATALTVLRESGGGLLAGAIAFRFFLFLVPCVFVLVMGLGLGADLAHADPQQVARQAGIAGLAATAIESGAGAPTTTRWMTLAVAVAAMLMGARNLLKAMWVAHALIWRVPARRLTHQVRSPLLLVLAFVGVTWLVRLVHLVRSVSPLLWVTGLALYTLVPVAVWLFCSWRLFPRRPGVTWRTVLPGALTFGVGVQLLHVVTVLWLTRSLQSKSEAYGAIGAALSLLVWAYLLGLLVTASAALNVALHTTAERRGGAPGSGTGSGTVRGAGDVSPAPDDDGSRLAAGH